jgi:hypothetical protein
MARKFSELREKMSQAARAQSEREFRQSLTKPAAAKPKTKAKAR